MKFPVPFQNRQWETFSDCFDFFSWKLFTLSLAGGFFHYKRIFFIFLATKPEPQTSSLKCGLSNLDLKQLKQKLCFAFSLKNNNNSTQNETRRKANNMDWGSWWRLAQLLARLGALIMNLQQSVGIRKGKCLRDNRYHANDFFSSKKDSF